MWTFIAKKHNYKLDEESKIPIYLTGRASNLIKCFKKREWIQNKN